MEGLANVTFFLPPKEPADDLIQADCDAIDLNLSMQELEKVISQIVKKFLKLGVLINQGSKEEDKKSF
jgi:hypothetical protein